MEARSFNYIESACGGRLRQGPPEGVVTRVCTDSRKLRAGDLFFTLKGPHFDGHAFLGEAMAHGASGAVVQAAHQRQGPLPDPFRLIEVPDTRKALGDLGARYRADFNLPVVAVGGSNGKTSTKELLASLLRQRYSTLSSEASFNNDIGVPLTLLNLQSHHETAVLEIGTNHPGELPPLIKMIQPQIGVITNIGREHLEFFGDLRGVVQEEGWLGELLPKDGRLFIPGDTPGMDAIVQRTQAAVVRIGFDSGADWRAKQIQLDETGSVFEVEAPARAYAGVYKIHLLGRHQVMNALLALAVGAEFGLTRDELRQGLAECQPAKMRLQFLRVNGVGLLDDTYNANTDSMRAALDALTEFPTVGRRIAVLGEMAELGAASADAHAEIGRRAAELRVDQLIAVGKMSGIVEQAAREAGLGAVRVFNEAEDAAAALKDLVRPGDLVLLKASRSMRLETVADLLRAELSKLVEPCSPTTATALDE